MADPAFRGFVESTLDALLIFEGCKRGMLPKITRRLQEFEKRALVVSGAVFVFSEEETGIKRWTDGLSWSPSRTLGNFLVYRELDKKGPAAGAAPPTDDSVGSSAPKTSPEDRGGDLRDPFFDSSFDSSEAGPSSTSTSLAQSQSTPGEASTSVTRRRSVSDTTGVSPSIDRARERALVGSLTSSYRFRSDGLVKKTISLSGLHMIGYYKIDDVTSGRLRAPSSHSELLALDISSTFLLPSLFRIPPLVETGQDGELKYKGEPDPTMSPTMTRSGSSQGFGTPVLGPTQSRPPSSESLSSRAASPRPPSASTSTQRDLPTPGSPHRSNLASSRSSNRYEPYVGRPAYGNQGQPAYPNPHSPNRSSFAQPQYQAEQYDRPDSPRDQRPISPLTPLGGLSSSTSSQNSGGNFYQPRQPIPYGPSDPGSSNTSVFAYQPPALSHPPRPPAERASPPLSYASFPPPPPISSHQPLSLRPQSSQHRPRTPSAPVQYSSTPQSWAPPTSSQPPPNFHPAYSQPHDPPPLPPPHLRSSSYDRRPSSFDQPRYYVEHPTSSLPPNAPSSNPTNPNPYYHVLTQPSYPTNYPGPSSYEEQQHQHQRARATGMVMGVGGDQDEDPRGGLNLGQEIIPPPLRGHLVGPGSMRQEQGGGDMRGVKRDDVEEQWWPESSGHTSWPPSGSKQPDYHHREQ